MDDQQLLRYSRHILLPSIGIEGQKRLLESRVVIVGVGGLGAPISMYLAASGVGRITLCDGDAVDLANLQRQIVHQTSSIGKPKVESAQDTLRRINPEIKVEAIAERVDESRLLEIAREADLVIDASDNFTTRHAVNRACVKLHKPLVSGAAIGFDGQVTVFDFREPTSPCYQCLYSEAGEIEETRCAVMGVFAPTVGIIGSIQAAEALKLLLGIGERLVGKLLLLDAMSHRWRCVSFSKDPQCKICGEC